MILVMMMVMVMMLDCKEAGVLKSAFRNPSPVSKLRTKLPAVTGDLHCHDEQVPSTRRYS